MSACSIDETAIDLLVPAFYARVRADALLGPIFESAIDDWPHHLAKLKDFWSSVMLASGRYKGQPMPAHIRHERALTNAKSYKRTATFTETTIPAGLPGDHSTKEGTWGLIRVENGALRYVVTDERRPPSERILTAAGEPGVVEPTILHHVAPVGPVRFHVEFLRMD
ncbi:hypothetical protein LTR94_015981 [Friedmanniomyces endolithicus]|nr:hypothetical protein LTR94_015981 [Friedmanniomyces endolithicus]